MWDRSWVDRARVSARCVGVAWVVVLAACSKDAPVGVPMAGAIAPPPAGAQAVMGIAGTPATGTGVAGTIAPATTGAAGLAAPSGASGTGLAAGSGASGTPAVTGVAGAAAGGGGASGATGMAGMMAMAGAGGAAGAPMMMPAGPPADCPQTPLAAGDHEYTLKSANGIEYKYILSVPKSVDQNQKTPLLIHWHALGSDPEEARLVTSVDAKVEAAKTLVVYPRSPDKSWDVGSCCTATVGGQSRDESVFVRELVKDVQTKACVDAKRIYTNGFSNGGMISQMIACKLPDLFAAAAPMGSTLTIPQAQCTPSRPIPIFLINGTDDPLVGYSTPGFAGGIAATADVKFWADKNKCEGEPEMFLMKGAATCKKYTKCAEGAEVAFCSVEGMGHCVPGMKKESAANCLTKSGIPLGPANDDIDAIQMDMDFLLRFSLP